MCGWDYSILSELDRPGLGEVEFSTDDDEVCADDDGSCAGNDAGAAGGIDGSKRNTCVPIFTSSGGGSS